MRKWMTLAAVVVLVGCNSKTDTATTSAPGATVAAIDTTVPAVTDTEPAKPSLAPATVAGKGDDVVTIPAGYAAPFLVAATHDGTANFIVEELDQAKTVGVLVNTIGGYKGQVLDSDDVTGLKVSADGAWSLTFSPVETATPFASTAKGTGDAVLMYQGATGVAHFTHAGTANFVVKIGTDLAVNEIGAYDGKVPMPDGPQLVTIEADGAWTVAVA